MAVHYVSAGIGCRRGSEEANIIFHHQDLSGEIITYTDKMPQSFFVFFFFFFRQIFGHRWCCFQDTCYSGGAVTGGKVSAMLTALSRIHHGLQCPCLKKNMKNSGISCVLFPLTGNETPNIRSFRNSQHQKAFQSAAARIWPWDFRLDFSFPLLHPHDSHASRFKAFTSQCGIRHCQV